MSRPVHEAFDIRRALDHGWAAFKAAPGPLLLGALLMQCTEGGGGSGGNWGQALEDLDAGSDGSGGTQSLAPALLRAGRAAALPASDTLRALAHDASGTVGAGETALIAGVILLALGVGLVCFLAILALRCWLEPGWYRLHHEVLANGAGRFETLFTAGDALLPLLGWKVLSGVVTLGTLLLAAVPGGALLAVGVVQEQVPLMISGGVLVVLLGVPALWYVSLGFWFGSRLVALEGLRPMEALERSWDLARGHRWRIWWFNLVLSLMQIAGILACCVGVLVTRPIAATGSTEAFLLHLRPRDETDAWWIRRARPDPGETPSPLPASPPG